MTLTSESSRTNNSEQDPILQGILEGDEKILGTLYEKQLPGIKRLITNNGGNEQDAEDTFQEALIFIHKRLRENKLNIDCSVTTFLYAVCRNMWSQKRKRQQKFSVTDSFDHHDYQMAEDMLHQLESEEKNRLFRSHFFKLSEGCRSILSLFFDGESMQNIATKLNISIQYARKKKFKCKETLINSIRKDSLFKELVDLNPEA